VRLGAVVGCSRNSTRNPKAGAVDVEDSLFDVLLGGHRMLGASLTGTSATPRFGDVRRDDGQARLIARS
jgi:hypothetical protein